MRKISAPKAVLVTSALPGEDNTSLAARLAVLNSQLGKRTLLVDLDLRHPRAAQQFGFEPAGGVVELVSGQRELAQVLHHDRASGVDVPPVKARPADPMGLLTSGQLRDLLHGFRQRYDCVIVDAPPLLGMTDAQILSLYTDATLFVIRWEHTKQDAARTALKVLEDMSANVIGGVLTQVDLKKHARYRHGDAGQYYRSYRQDYND